MILGVLGISSKAEMTVVAKLAQAAFEVVLHVGVAGAILRSLRGKVPPVAGILAATFGGSWAGSMLTLSRPEVFAFAGSALEGRAGPLSLALILLIPCAAVFRSRDQPTLPWMVVAGIVAGVLIGFGHV